MELTIAIPFFNNIGTLAASIDSVLSQTFHDFELLLVDDGSSDGSLQVAMGYVDHRVEVVSDGRNRGLVFRLNEIARRAKGEFLARMDADDICAPNRLARQLGYLKERADVDVLATGAWVIDQHTRVIGRRHCKPIPESSRAPLSRGVLLHPTVMARTDWFIANPYDSAFVRAEDKELWCRTWKTARFARIPEPLLYYRDSTALRTSAYRRSCRTDRRILRHFGPKLVGWPATVIALSESVTIEAATLLASELGLGERVVRWRNTTVAASDLAEAQLELDSIIDLGLRSDKGGAKERGAP